MTLAAAQPNRIYRISSVKEGMAQRRLLDMGFTPGAEIYVMHRAPGGGAFLVGLRGFTVALRDDAASSIVLSDTEAGNGK